MSKLVLPALLLLVATGCPNGDSTVKVADDPPTIVVVSPIAGAAFDPLVPVQFCLAVADNSSDSLLQIVAQSTVDGEIWAFDGEPVECAGGNIGFEATLSDNDHSVQFTVTDVAGNGTVTASNVGCTTTGVTFTTTTGLTQVVGAGATVAFTLTGKAAMASTSVNSCQGNTFTIPVTLTATT